MRIIITGGGTGGHIYPAIAVANEINSRWDKPDILFVGTEMGIEARAVPAAGFPIKHIKASGISLRPLRFLKFIFNNTAGLFQALSILNSFKPDLVIGSGGFVSAPVMTAAALKKIPAVLLEQNVLPGKTNRFLSRWAKKILASFDESKKYLPAEKVVVTGNPIRKEIIERTREEAFRILKLSPDRFTLLITGASQGARSINNAVIKALPLWRDKGWQVIHLVGRKNYNEVNDATRETASDFKGEYRCIDYTEDMASAYAAADLVAGRAGASTLAEITARGLASILIPYPHAADNHQEKNARCVEEAGGSIVILDGDIEEKFAEEVISLSENKKKLADMSASSKKLGKPDALANIMRELDEFRK